MLNESEQHERFLRLLLKDERRIRRYVLALIPDRVDADDVMQETSLALWRKFDEYRPAQPFFSWACRFAHYQALSHRKRKAVRNRHLQFSDAVINSLASEQLEHQELLDAQKSALSGCVKKLSTEDRELVQLRYSTDVAVAEVARSTGQPAKSLYRMLERIRRQLVKCVIRELSAEGLS